MNSDLNQIIESTAFKNTAYEIVETVRFLSKKGWTPATSSNFSARIETNSDLIAISKSGVDKETFGFDDILIVDNKGFPLLSDDYNRSSAETMIHIALYEDSKICSVLHTHSVNSTIVSKLYNKNRLIEFTNLEILKGLNGNSTHEVTEQVPVFSNTQNIKALAEEITAYKCKFPGMHCFLIEGHGLYSWGRCLKEAKRHIEVFEFLFECLLKGDI